MAGVLHLGTLQTQQEHFLQTQMQQTSQPNKLSIPIPKIIKRGNI